MKAFDRKFTFSMPKDFPATAWSPTTSRSLRGTHSCSAPYKICIATHGHLHLRWLPDLPLASCLSQPFSLFPRAARYSLGLVRLRYLHWLCSASPAIRRMQGTLGILRMPSVLCILCHVSIFDRSHGLAAAYLLAPPCSPRSTCPPASTPS